MPVTAVKPNVTSKFETEVRQQLAQVARRIRTHDLLCGLFLLGMVAFGYLAVVIALDRWLDLPAWVRQLGFVGLLAALGAVAFYGVVRPLRRTVNPLYAAKEIEDEVTDAKNSVVNWVDLQDQPLAEGVRAVVAARAAKQFKDADLDKAGESKRLLWLGGTTAGLVVVLAVLFMIFKPAVFNSLLGRAVNPFFAGQIGTRTQLTVVQPKDGDLTVTAGQPVTIGVVVNGKVPSKDAPDRLVVLLRHNLADENYDEVPLEEGDTTREWSLRMPERLVQNGFWYKVRGGDAETAEHHVTVRPKPTFTDFEVKYEYPEYLRMTADATRNPHLEGHRGTVVTVTAKANRTLKDGRATFPKPPVVPGEVVTDAKDSLRVRFPLTASGSYRLQFTSAEGETNGEPPAYDIRVLSDQPPTVTITAPTDESTTLPVNGSLAVDGQIGDDFGLDTVTLRLKLVAPNQPPKLLQPKPYQNGQSFKRAADGTYPTALQYKDSVPFAGLKDETGAAVDLKPDMTIEYWLEARDNCTVPEANVGKSRVQKVVLTPAPEEPKRKDEVQKQAANRRGEDAKFQQQQQQNLDKEQRPAANPSPQKQNGEAQPPEGTDAKAEGAKPGEATKPADARNPTEQPAKPDGAAEPKPTPGAKADTPQPEPMPPANQKEPPSNKAGQPGDNPGQPMGEPPPAAEPKNADEAAAKKKQLQQQAQELQRKLDDLEKRAGEAKGNDQPQPDQQQAGGEKKAKPTGGEAGEAKPSADKDRGSDPQEKQGPLGGAGATEKPTDANEKKPGEPQEKPDAGSARSQKPTAPGESKKGPKPADAAQPKGDPKAGGEQPEQKGGGATEQSAAKEKPTPGEANDDRGRDPAKQQELEQTVKDLAGHDEQKKQAARDKLDQEFGKDAREQVERNMERRKRAADNLQSNDQKQKAQGEKLQTDLQREAAEKDGTEQERKSRQGDADTLDRKEIEQAVDDLNSGDKSRQEAGRKKLDQKLGEKGRKEIEKLNEDMKSRDKDQQQGAADELQKKQKQQAKNAAEQQKQDIEQATKDLAGNDPQKKQAAQQKLDQAVGEQARKEAEKDIQDRKDAAEKLQSKDPKQQASGEEKLNELQQKQMSEQKGQTGGQQPTEAEKQELRDAARDLNSDDPKKREAAQQKLDRMVGQDARKGAEKLRDDLKSGDPARQQAAKEQVKKLQEQAQKQAGNKPADAAKQKELEQAAKDLAGDDAQKKQAARDKLDKEIGKGAREDLEKRLDERKKTADDLNSNDAEQRARGEENKKRLQREDAAAGSDQKQADDADRLDRKELEDALKDLNSDDPQKKQAGRDKLDKMVGEEARKKAEQMHDDLKSGDPTRQKGAVDELKKMQKEAENQARKEGDKKEPKADNKPSPEEVEKLAQAAKDLQSPDQQKQQDARKQLDDKLGEPARKKLEEQLPKDGKEPTPEQTEAAKKAIEEAMKGQPNGDATPKDRRRSGAPGINNDDRTKPLEANKEFDKAAADLMIEKLKKIQHDKEADKKLGYNEEDLKRFIDGYSKMAQELADLKDGLADGAKPTDPARPTAQVGNAGRLDQRANGSTSTTSGGGVSVAPPGYDGPRKKFAEGASKPKDK